MPRRSSYLSAEFPDLPVHLIGLLLKLLQGLVLDLQSLEELVLVGLQQVFGDGAGLLRLSHGAERT